MKTRGASKQDREKDKKEINASSTTYTPVAGATLGSALAAPQTSPPVFIIHSLMGFLTSYGAAVGPQQGKLISFIYEHVCLPFSFS